jgi:hypothetical protein
MHTYNLDDKIKSSHFKNDYVDAIKAANRQDYNKAAQLSFVARKNAESFQIEIPKDFLVFERDMYAIQIQRFLHLVSKYLEQVNHSQAKSFTYMASGYAQRANQPIPEDIDNKEISEYLQSSNNNLEAVKSLLENSNYDEAKEVIDKLTQKTPPEKVKIPNETLEKLASYKIN